MLFLASVSDVPAVSIDVYSQILLFRYQKNPENCFRLKSWRFAAVSIVGMSIEIAGMDCK